MDLIHGHIFAIKSPNYWRKLLIFYGSSVQGYRLNKKSDKGLWFDKDSNYDIVITSEVLYKIIKPRFPDLIFRHEKHTYSLPSDINRILFSSIVKATRNCSRRCQIFIYENIDVL